MDLNIIKTHWGTKPDMLELQEKDLANISDRGISYNLQDFELTKEYFKDGAWYDVKPGVTLFDLVTMGFIVRKKPMLKSL